MTGVVVVVVVVSYGELHVQIHDLLAIAPTLEAMASYFPGVNGCIASQKANRQQLLLADLISFQQDAKTSWLQAKIRLTSNEI